MVHDQFAISNVIDDTILSSNAVALTYTDEDLKIYDDLFSSIIAMELERLININTKYKAISNKIVVGNSLNTFFEKVYSASCPRILKKITSEKQLYLLHILAICLTRYNDNELKMEEEEFIDNIFIPNLMIACAKPLTNARQLIKKIVKKSYNNVLENSKDIADYYSKLKSQDYNILQNNIMNSFLRNVIVKFDPLSIANINEFYQNLVKRIFFHQLNMKFSVSFDNDMNHMNYKTDFMSTRTRIYEEALYLVQIDKLCSKSATVEHISKQYDKLKNIILTNEIQKLFMYGNSKYQYTDKQNKILLIDSYTSGELIDKFKYKTPIIHRLLRSVHVISEKSSFLSLDITRIKEAIYVILYNKFEKMLSESAVKILVETISEVVVNSLIKGEFIDMTTLTKVDISGSKFIDQLIYFLEVVLNDVDLNC